MKESDKNIDKVIQAAEEILTGKKVSVKLDPEILTAIKQVLAKKEIQADPNFKKSLDKNIKKALLNITKVRKSSHPLKEKIMKYFLIFLSGSFATALVVVVALNQFNVIDFPFEKDLTQEEKTIGEDIVDLDDVSALLNEEADEINEVSHKDFGEVPDIGSAGTQSKGGDDGVETTSATFAGKGGGGGEIMMESRMIPPYPGRDLYPPEITYTYSGSTEVSIPGSMSIYKTKKTEIASTRLESLLGNLGMVAGKFIENGKLTMQHMSFFNSGEKRSYNVDFNSGIINFHTNREYDREKKRPTKKDVPADSELINIANTFLKEHGIDPSTLNTPEIDKRWETYYNEDQDFVPSEITVIYPRMIDSVFVVDYSGGKVGQVRISIDIIDKQAMSGSVNLSLNMDKTEYEAQKFSAIKETLEKTGGTNAFNYGPMPLRIDTPDEDLKPYTIDANYKEATLAYIEKYQWKDNETKIYYIPVVMFKGDISNSEQEKPYEQVTFVPVISAESFK